MFLFKKKNPEAVTARDRDKERTAAERKSKEKKSKTKRRKIKRTVFDTMPYECFVSNYVCLLRSNVRAGRETVNLYSKTYLVPDVNYAALPEDQQWDMVRQYVGLLNSFDSQASLQVTLVNTSINREDFEQRLMLQHKDDGLNEERDEFIDEF